MQPYVDLTRALNRRSYQGDLSIYLSSGLTIRIPNNQLVVPDSYIASNGAYMANYTTREVLVNSLQDVNTKDLPILGRAFLTSAYLMVNQDEGTFTLWSAKATTDQDLVGVGNGTSCVPLAASNTATPSSPLLSPLPPTATSPATLQPKAGSTTNGMTPGEQAGTAVGVILGITVVLAPAIFFCYRRKKKRSVPVISAPIQWQQHESAPPYFAHLPPQEVHGDHAAWAASATKGGNRAQSRFYEMAVDERPQEVGEGMRHELGQGRRSRFGLA